MEVVVRQEQGQHPPRTYPPISQGKNLSITYVESQSLPIGDENYLRNLSDVKVKIGDLGVGRFLSLFCYVLFQPWSDKLVLSFLACWADKVSEHIADLIQSPSLRAPEVEIGAGWDKSCDTWSMGCNVCLTSCSSLQRRITYLLPACKDLPDVNRKSFISDGRWTFFACSYNDRYFRRLPIGPNKTREVQ